MHDLKIWARHLEDIIAGRKRFEIRSRSRGEPEFRVGDLIHLREWNTVSEEYSGRQLAVRVTLVHAIIEPDFDWHQDGLYVLGIDPLWSDRRSTVEDQTPFTERHLEAKVFCPECAVGEFPTQIGGAWCHEGPDSVRVCLWADRFDRSLEEARSVIADPPSSGGVLQVTEAFEHPKQPQGRHPAFDGGFLYPSAEESPCTEINRKGQRCRFAAGHDGSHLFLAPKLSESDEAKIAEAWAKDRGGAARSITGGHHCGKISGDEVCSKRANHDGPHEDLEHGITWTADEEEMS